MTETNDRMIRELLRKSIAPVTDLELKRDLWPRMLQKLDERPFGASWLDWVLAALLPLWLILFPSVIPGLVYHL
jgi:hypothetical protein